MLGIYYTLKTSKYPQILDKNLNPTPTQTNKNISPNTQTQIDTTQ